MEYHPATAKEQANMDTIIIKIESGIVADVYSTVPVQVVVVDHDVI
jgi:hypothetical protein